MQGITIKDAPLVEELTLEDKIPISNGSNQAVTASIQQIKDIVSKDLISSQQLEESERLTTEAINDLNDRIQDLANSIIEALNTEV